MVKRCLRYAVLGGEGRDEGICAIAICEGSFFFFLVCVCVGRAQLSLVFFNSNLLGANYTFV